MAAIEGSYAVMFTKGPAGWSHPDSAAVILAAATLNAAESYLWKYIRGSGLTYGCWVSSDRESGLIEFAVYRVGSTHNDLPADRCRVQTLARHSRRLQSCSRDWLMDPRLWSRISWMEHDQL